MDQPSGESLTLPVQEHSVEVIHFLPRSKANNWKQTNNKLTIPGTTLTLLDHQLNDIDTAKTKAPQQKSNYKIMLSLFNYSRRKMPYKFARLILNTFKMVDEAVIDRAALLTPMGYFLSKEDDI